MKNDLVYLVTVIREQNENGFYEEKYVRREVFAELKSITRSEHYSADRAGKKVQLIAVVNNEDYQLSIIETDNEKQKYEAETMSIDGSMTKEVVIPRIRKEPEYVEMESVRYRIERNYKKPGDKDRELTLSQVE